MRIKLSKKTIQSIKTVLVLLVLLLAILQVQKNTREDGEAAIKNFLHSLGVEQ